MKLQILDLADIQRRQIIQNVFDAVLLIFPKEVEGNLTESGLNNLYAYVTLQA